MRHEVTSNFCSETLPYFLLRHGFLLYFRCRSQLRGWARERDVERMLEEERMFELGNVLNTGYIAPAIDPTLNGTSNSAEATDSGNSEAEVYAAVETSESLQLRLQQTDETAEEPRYPVYSDASELVMKLREEIGAVNSFEGFLIGVHNKIEEFQKYLELDIKNIRGFVDRVTSTMGSAQRSESPPARASEGALAAWQSQANLEPDRVLALLKDAAEQTTAAADGQVTAPPQQTA